MKSLIETLSCLFSENSCYIVRLLSILLFIYILYLSLRLLFSVISTFVITIKDAKVELKTNEESKSNEEAKERGSEKFGIPNCADYRYKSFYFGLRPYFQHVFGISEKDIDNYEKNPQKSGNIEENEKFIKFYMAELLCYRYFAFRKIANFFFPFISYETLSYRQIKKIKEKVEEQII